MANPENRHQKEIDITDPSALEARAAKSINGLEAGGLLARARALSAAADIGLAQSLREKQAADNPDDLDLQEQARRGAGNVWAAADIARTVRRDPDYFKNLNLRFSPSSPKVNPQSEKISD